MIVCIGGKFYNKGDSKISIFDRGLSYGDGIFETIPTFNEKIIFLEEHIDRLFEGCQKLYIELPWSKENIINFTKKVFDDNKKFNYGKIRIILTRGSTKDFSITEGVSDCEPQIVIFITENKLPSKKELDKGLKLLTTNEIRPYPEIKTTNFIPSVLGQILAQKKGYDDVLFIKNNNIVLEGGRFNIFIIKNNFIKTSSDDILKGITREKTIGIVKKLGYTIIKENIELNELIGADEVFATGTTKRIISVTQVNKNIIGNGKPGIITKKIMNQFSKLFY